MSLDRRTLQAVVLLAWCGFMTWMWVSGETLRYLGPRTEWVVPFGAAMLALAAAASVYGARRDPAPEPVSPREGLGLLVLVVPILTAALLAHSQLGAQAASKKLASRGIDPSALASLASGDAGELGFLQLSVAQKDHDFAAKNGITAGKEVRLLGFVSRRSARAGAAFDLSRFYITCCVADSIPIGVSVSPPQSGSTDPPRDQWLDVTGHLVRRAGGRLSVQADRVRPVRPPKHPYLSITS